MKLVNLTKHPLTLHDKQGALVEVPPDPRHIGVEALGDHRTARDADGHAFSLNVRRVTDIKKMPEPEDGTLYVVPPEVAMALQEEREDVAFPAQEAQVRDAGGRLRRVTHLRRVLSTRSNGSK
jgi:hypothetical protein